MSLIPGKRLGPYEIVAPLGAGGMGEVYRARDTRLGRDVAIKVLPQQLSGTPELRARFEREARSISQLNHPNICVLHDVGREGDTDFLVMELVEGETLERRLTRGPVPLPELLRIGSEVASALDRAHRSGIVHRDLKPGNIMLTRAGSKLMDFGLARAAGGPVTSTTQAAMTQSPTVAQALTGEGKIVGTFQYMSPEQLEGKEADARSDLWALGCVLYEMATGSRPFSGAGTASLIASIMKDEPRMLADLAPMSPPALDRVVTRCLAKDPDERWQSARDLAAELRYIGESTPAASRTQPASTVEVRKPTMNRERVFWSAALVGVVLVALALQMLQQPGTDTGTNRLVQFNITTPEEIYLVGDAAEPSISPDGSMAAFWAVDSSGAALLWVRPMDSADPKPLVGTDNGQLCFWSPDSKYLGFFADGKLKKIRVEGGPPQILCDANNGRGGSWSKDGTIVFCPAAEGPLYRVSAAGGTPTPLTTLDTAAHETGHRWPWFLPDGKHFVYVVLPGQDLNFDAYVASVDGGAREKLFSASSAPTYAEPGYLLYIRNGTVIAQPFDAGSRKLKGEPSVLKALTLRSDFTGAPFVKASVNGTLIHRTPGSPNTEMVLYDRQGRVTRKLPMSPGRFDDLSLSGDGNFIVVNRVSSPTTSDLWLVDVERAMSTRFTFGGGESFSPAWSPDGQRVAFTSNRSGRENIYVRSRLGQSAETLLYESNMLFKHSCQWTQDGQHIVIAELGENTGWDILLVDAKGSGKAVPLLTGPFNEPFALISPDGKWIAYTSDESGRAELYVDTFPVAGNKIQISSAGMFTMGGGGGFMGWRADGRELVYESPDFKMMSVEIETSPAFRAGTPRPLFRFRPSRGVSMSDDGQFFVATTATGSANVSVSVVMNWTELLKH